MPELKDGLKHMCWKCDYVFPDHVPLSVHFCNQCCRRLGFKNVTEVYDLIPKPEERVMMDDGHEIIEKG